jgi:hypothetical protein
LEQQKGCLHISREPYNGDLSPSVLRKALEYREIIPKTALLFLVFLVEAGLAPTGGMTQTRYATQIRDRMQAWLSKHRPLDPRREALLDMPTDRAVLTPLWGVNNKRLCEPVSYDDALAGWRMTGETADKLLKVSGAAALNAGGMLTNDFMFSDNKLSEKERYTFLRDMADSGELLVIE